MRRVAGSSVRLRAVLLLLLAVVHATHVLQGAGRRAADGLPGPPGSLDVTVSGPQGITVNAVSPAAEGLFWERLPLDNRTAFTLDFENNRAQPVTFTGATAFLLDEQGVLSGTIDIDAATFAARRTISDVGNLFVDGRVMTNILSASTEGARDLAVDPAGFVTAGAGLHSASQTQRLALVRYSPNGAEDLSFGGSGKVLADVAGSFHEGADAIAVDADGRLVVAGFAEPVLGQRQVLVARFLPDGTFDPTFNGTGWHIVSHGTAAEATAVAIDGAGRIIAGGWVSDGSTQRFLLIRLQDNGALDPAFGGDGIVDANIGAQSERLEALAVDAAGRTVAAGRGTLFGSDRFVVARYGTAGALDGTFGIGGATLTAFPGASTARAFDLVIAPSGRIVVAGEAVVADRSQVAVARYNTDGTLHDSFDDDGRVLVDVAALGGGVGSVTTMPVLGGYARSVALDAIGRILLTGPAFTTHSSQMAVLRLDGIGELDPSFGGDGTAYVTFDGTADADAFGILRHSDDTIVVAGTAFAPGDGGYFAVGRLRPNGTRYSVLTPETSIPSGARVKLPFPFNNFPRKLTPATINVRVQFAEIAQPLFITGITPTFYEMNGRPYRFPLQNPPVGLWRPGQGHDIHENHYGTPSQRYAYDLSVFNPDGNTGTREDCDVAALVAQYAIDPLYDYDIDPNGTYVAKDFAECALAYGEPVRAAAAGRVVRANDGYPNNFPVGTKLPELYLDDSDPDKIGGGGNSVTIRHDSGEFTFYAHMRPGSVQVVAGQQVVGGQLLGQVGNTGSSSGTHLHFHLMNDYVPPPPQGPPGLAQGPLPTPGHGRGLPIYFYDLAFSRGPGQPVVRQLRSAFNTATRLDIDPEPVPVFDFPAPQYGPGSVVEAEPNHTLVNAQRLVLPVEVDGTIATSEPVDLADAGDGLEDIYRFRLAQSRVVLARLTFSEGSDLDLQLVSSLLHPFAPQMGTRLHNPEVVVATLRAGTHYAFVSRFDDGVPGSAQYTLEIEVFGSTIAAFIESLGLDLWRNPGDRQVVMAELSQVERAVAADQFDRAFSLLRRLRDRVDGCARNGSPDRDDALRSCDAQRSMDTLLGQMMSDLGPSSRTAVVR